MNCPSCFKPMTSEVRDGVPVEKCRPCSLLWMDREKVEFARREQLSRHAAAASAKFMPASGAEPKKCPSCGEMSLELGTIGISSVSACKRCGGCLIEDYSDIQLWLVAEAILWLIGGAAALLS